MSSQLKLDGREQPVPSFAVHSEAYICRVSSRLGIYSTNLPPWSSPEDPYECSFHGKNADRRNQKLFEQYLKDKGEIEFLSFFCSYFPCEKHKETSPVETSPVYGVEGEQYSHSQHDYGHRWTVGYKKKFLYRLHLLEEWYKWLDKPVTFVTLTTRQDLEREDQILLLKDGFNQFREKYIRQIGKMSYLSALDFHKTGYGHIHMVIFDEVKPSFQSNMMDLWEVRGYGDKNIGIKFIRKQNGEIAKIVNYLFKHTAKVFNLSARGAMRFHTTVFAMEHSENHEYPGIRLFSMSRDIAKIMKMPESELDTLSFQMGEKLLYINPDMTQSQVGEKLDYYQKWFQNLHI